MTGASLTILCGTAKEKKKQRGGRTSERRREEEKKDKLRGREGVRRRSEQFEDFAKMKEDENLATTSDRKSYQDKLSLNEDDIFAGVDLEKPVPLVVLDDREAEEIDRMMELKSRSGCRRGNSTAEEDINSRNEGNDKTLTRKRSRKAANEMGSDGDEREGREDDAIEPERRESQPWEMEDVMDDEDFEVGQVIGGKTESLFRAPDFDTDTDEGYEADEEEDEEDADDSDGNSTEKQKWASNGDSSELSEGDVHKRKRNEKKKQQPVRFYERPSDRFNQPVHEPHDAIRAEESGEEVPNRTLLDLQRRGALANADSDDEEEDEGDAWGDSPFDNVPDESAIQRAQLQKSLHLKQMKLAGRASSGTAAFVTATTAGGSLFNEEDAHGVGIVTGLITHSFLYLPSPDADAGDAPTGRFYSDPFCLQTEPKAAEKKFEKDKRDSLPKDTEKDFSSPLPSYRNGSQVPPLSLDSLSPVPSQRKRPVPSLSSSSSSSPHSSSSQSLVPVSPTGRSSQSSCTQLSPHQMRPQSHLQNTLHSSNMSSQAHNSKRKLSSAAELALLARSERFERRHLAAAAESDDVLYSLEEFERERAGGEDEDSEDENGNDSENDSSNSRIDSDNELNYTRRRGRAGKAHREGETQREEDDEESDTTSSSLKTASDCERMKNRRRLRKAAAKEVRKQLNADKWEQEWKQTDHPLLFRFVSGWWRIASFLHSHNQRNIN